MKDAMFFSKLVELVELVEVVELVVEELASCVGCPLPGHGILLYYSINTLFLD